MLRDLGSLKRKRQLAQFADKTETMFIKDPSIALTKLKAFVLGASKTVQQPKNMTVNFKTLPL